jgi:5-formyltetrahydrofolate cyclo-ligase
MPTGFSPDPGRVDQLPHVRLFQVPLLAGDVPDRALGTGAGHGGASMASHRTPAR